MQERALAGARRPHDGGERAAVEAGGHAVERDDRAVAAAVHLADAVEANRGLPGSAAAASGAAGPESHGRRPFGGRRPAGRGLEGARPVRTISREPVRPAMGSAPARTGAGRGIAAAETAGHPPWA